MIRGFVGGFGARLGILEGTPGAFTIRPGPEAAQPSYLALSSQSRVVYAAMTDNGAGVVGAFSFDDEHLTPIGLHPAGTDDLCHISVGYGHVLAASYRSGAIVMFPIEPDGTLRERSDLICHAGSGPNTERQAGAHAHMVVADAFRNAVIAIDLGTDTIYRYVLNDSRLEPSGAIQLHGGAGPRHMAFHPEGRYAYIANELDSTVSILDLPTFTILSTTTTSNDPAVESYPSAIRVSGDGRFCYVANRGPDVIATLAVSDNGSDVHLLKSAPSGGSHPRDFVLEDQYLYVANQHTNAITTFEVDKETGGLQPSGPTLSFEAPSCLLFTESSQGTP